MKNANKITVPEAIAIGNTLIAALIKGFENIGFRKNTREDIKTLKEIVITQNKRIEDLEKKINN